MGGPSATIAAGTLLDSKSSSARGLTTWAREVALGPAALSTMRHRTPRSNRNNAADSPVGPAPTTRGFGSILSYSSVITLIFGIGGACQGSVNYARSNSCQKNLTVIK